MTERPIDRCSAPYRVRFDEAGPDGLLRTSVLLRYAQDLAWYHAAQRGFDRAWYAGRGLTWLVRAAQVAVLTPVRVGDELVGTTWAVGQRRVWARRRSEFHRAGEPVGWTDIDWLLLDARGAPARIPPEFDVAFGTPPTAIGLARVDLGETPATARTSRLRLRPQEQDPMGHANNAAYADWLEEAVIEAGDVEAVRRIPRAAHLEYARAAEPGVDLTARAWRDADGWAFRLSDADDIDLLRARLEAGPA